MSNKCALEEKAWTVKEKHDGAFLAEKTLHNGEKITALLRFDGCTHIWVSEPGVSGGFFEATHTDDLYSFLQASLEILEAGRIRWPHAYGKRVQNAQPPGEGTEDTAKATFREKEK